MFRFSQLLVLVLAMGLLSCAVGPDYKPLSPSELKMPQQWHAQVAHNGSNTQLLQWWAQFKDPTLTKLIQAAVGSNPSLLDSLAKIKQAQASIGISKAAFYPSLSLTPSATLSNGGAGSVNIDGTPTPLLNNLTSGISGAYAGNIYSNWEIDLFGATRRSLEAAAMRLAATTLEWNDARVSLVSDVADNYVQYRVCQDLVATYQQQLSSNAETRRITALKITYGRNSQGDANQANASYFASQAMIEQESGQCRLLENKLISLTGLEYAALESQLKVTRIKVPVPQLLSIAAIPAAVLSQRPDVAAAEREVAAANADIGNAMAKRYPTLSLTGLIAFNPGASPLSWSLNPSLLLPITDGGYLASQVSLKRANYLQAVATYKTKVVAAVNEVEDALSRIAAATKQSAAQLQAADNYQAYFAIMNHKYQLGSINILDLELARSNMLSAQTSLYNVQLAQVRAWIALYKASGGSWDHDVAIRAPTLKTDGVND